MDDVSEIDGYARALAEGIEAALGGWVERGVERTMAATGVAVPDDIAVAAADAGRCATRAVMPVIRALLASDIDEQRSTPLAVIRAMAVPYPTEVLHDAGIQPLGRDRFEAEAFPGDVYRLSPASFAELSPEVGEAGLAWGAAKAFEHLRRHRS